MIHLILLILLNLSLIPYILVIVYPSVQPWQYILITGILNVLNIFIYIKYLKSKNIFSDVYLLKINRYFYLKWVVAIVFISIGLNFMINRWIFDSYGLWDAWAMWNLTAKVITYSIINFSDVKIFDDLWNHMDYPLTLPLLHVSLALVFGEWSETISYLLNILFFILTLLIYSKSISKTFIITPILVIPLFATNPLYLNLASDLCADHFLALFLLSFLFGINLEENQNKIVFYCSPKIALSLFGMSIIKNEGFLYASLAIFLLIMLNFLKSKKVFIKQNFFYFLIFALIFILNFGWKYFVYSNVGKIESDFAFSDIVSKLINIFETKQLDLIFSYFIKFHFIDLKGIIILTLIYILFFSQNQLTKYMAIYLVLILFLLNFLFLFSQNLEWHLSTAYYRINLVILPSVLYLWIINYKEFINLNLFKPSNLPKEISS